MLLSSSPTSSQPLPLFLPLPWLLLPFPTSRHPPLLPLSPSCHSPLPSPLQFFWQPPLSFSLAPDFRLPSLFSLPLHFFPARRQPDGSRLSSRSPLSPSLLLCPPLPLLPILRPTSNSCKDNNGQPAAPTTPAAVESNISKRTRAAALSLSPPVLLSLPLIVFFFSFTFAGSPASGDHRTSDRQQLSPVRSSRTPASSDEPPHQSSASHEVLECPFEADLDRSVQVHFCLNYYLLFSQNFPKFHLWFCDFFE